MTANAFTCYEQQILLFNKFLFKFNKMDLFLFTESKSLENGLNVYSSECKGLENGLIAQGSESKSNFSVQHEVV